MSMSKEAIEALEDARAHILDSYRIWQADDVSAVPPPLSGAGAAIAKIDAALSSSPGKDGGQEVEAVAWQHPTAGWTSTDYYRVLMHCKNDGPFPVPLYACPPPASTALVERLTTFDRDYPEFYWHVAKGKICAGEPLYGAIITRMNGTEIGHGESNVSAEAAFEAAFVHSGLPALSASQSTKGDADA